MRLLPAAPPPPLPLPASVTDAYFLLSQLAKGAKELETFKSLFAGATIKSGDVISFAIKGGKVTTSICGKAKASIASAPLAKALLSVYIGPSSVTPDAKAMLVAELTTRLAK
jgi:Chalcone isomerase-like